MTWTIQSLLDWTTDYFSKLGIPNARLDAEVLLAHTLGVERIQLYIKFDHPVGEEERSKFKSFIARRVQHEPVSYIRGFKEFWSMAFKVGPGVLIPRPETELLVEKIIGCCSSLRGENKEIKILDIGTGSGNIAIALAKEIPEAQITAVDKSEKALDYARENAEKNQVAHRIEFKNLDVTQALITNAQYSIIVSNPPYIKTEVIQTLDIGITRYEPLEALDGGPDGLNFYRKLGECAKVLQSSMVAVEIGEDQAEVVQQIFRDGGYETSMFRDPAGHPRIVITKGLNG